MNITRRVTFRIYPSKAQAQKLSYWRAMHKELYNAALYQRKTEYQKFGEVGFGIIGGFLTYKVAEAGGFYLELPTQSLKPTQRCAKCWELTPKTLADRTHVCSNSNCKHEEDRDVNAAQVNIIWARGQELACSDAELPIPTSCPSMKQMGAKKRQKHRPCDPSWAG